MSAILRELVLPEVRLGTIVLEIFLGEVIPPETIPLDIILLAMNLRGNSLPRDGLAGEERGEEKGKDVVETSGFKYGYL